jgi:hypothetical protein
MYGYFMAKVVLLFWNEKRKAWSFQLPRNSIDNNNKIQWKVSSEGYLITCAVFSFLLNFAIAQAPKEARITLKMVNIYTSLKNQIKQ